MLIRKVSLTTKAPGRPSTGSRTFEGTLLTMTDSQASWRLHQLPPKQSLSSASFHSAWWANSR